MPIDLLSFDEALKDAGDKKRILLGNGFSIALRPDIFSYSSLFENADFSEASHIPSLFEAIGSKDFEAIIRLLVDMTKILQAYGDVPSTFINQVAEDANTIKNALANAIAKNHPDRPYSITEEQYVACRLFLSNFEYIYSLNYDVLLYWALMHSDVDKLDIRPDDGFRHPEGNEDAPYVSWQEANKSTVHFLHGALHLFDAGHEITKYTWSKTDLPIVDQIRSALDEEKYPLFVAEGHSEAKLAKILHNAYLHKALRSFSSIGGSLFIFGHSFDENDNHILGRIPYGRIQNLYVGLYGDTQNSSNVKIIERSKSFVAQRAEIPRKTDLNLHFFDASTARVWG